MATGKIKTLLPDKGFGFIALDGGSNSSDLFFHNTAVAEGTFDDLRTGQSVSFDVEPDPRDSSRKRATNVRPAAADESE